MGKDSAVYSRKGKGIQVEKPKEKRVIQHKNGGATPRKSNAPLVINEERAQARLARVERADVELQEETVGTPAKEAKEPIPIKKYHDALKKCTIVQTRWPDSELLTKLNILEDVRMLLRGIGMEKVLDMDYVCYPKHVMSLIASFDIHFNRKPSLPSDLGHVSFRINRRSYTVDFTDLCDAYGFPQKMMKRFPSLQSADSKVWDMIGQGDYNPGKMRSRQISNPAIRYVHKILTNTIFARQEGDKIIEDELALLTNGLLPMFRERFKEEDIRGYRYVNLGVILAKRIMYIKNWALRANRKHSSIHIGGFLTPLLEVAEVPLTDPCTSPRLKLDFTSLRRMNFLEPRDDERVTFTFLDSDSETVKVLLPNEEITRLDSLVNLKFERGKENRLIDIDPVEALLSMRDEDGNEPRHASTDLPLGSPRYYHSPYKGTNRSKPIEHIFGEMSKTHRWNKWNSRSIHNIKRSCKRKMKAMEEQLSGLKNIIETYVFQKKTPPRREDGEFDFEIAMEEARRHSISHLPSSSSRQAFDPPRTSSHQQQSQRRRRLRHIPSPSPNSSDNPSLHLTSSEEEASN